MYSIVLMYMYSMTALMYIKCMVLSKEYIFTER